MNADNAAGFMSGINWTTDVVQDIVVPIVQESESGSGSGSGSGQALTLTAAPDRGEWEKCTDSTQCKNQCCSSKYSDGVLKCTPVGGFKPSEGCVGSSTSTSTSSTSTTSTSKLGEWQQCSNSKQCNNQCCSGKYSDGVLKCTPVGGFKPSEGCVGSATRRLRGNNEAEVLTADETNTNFMHYAAPVDELGRDVEYGDELN